MAYEIVIHQTAQDAIVQIIEYLNLVSGGTQAGERFVSELENQVSLVARNPDLYALSRIPELANAGYHAMLVNSYTALYFVSGGQVHISYVFHQSQDYARYIL